ncbi:VOC family protein [Streptomyces sp. AJS327]|uniref:VOC family protein n=1 Tax=Streptomyces sp. AJS327 TaxID=2545265 RepID=UPI0015DF17FC|nr:VOC family protein [Streptomyces sp. AJS327]MBA0053307.1 VOC family protein [Streptomyces sp. AJS327]
MAIQLNHTIVHATDKRASAHHLAHVLGLEVGADTGPFTPVDTGNGVTLDFANHPGDDGQGIQSQHYAFLVSEEEFDGIFARVQEQGITYYSGPTYDDPGNINRRDDGRGFYWHDPDGHAMEVLTVPYGGFPT